MLQHVRRNRARGHRSQLESTVEDGLQQQGLICNYEKESFVYYRKGRYTPDFTVDCEHPFHIEVKGYWFPDDRGRLKAVVLNNPDIRLLIAFQRPFMKITKKSKTTYAAWAEKLGLCWSTIPIPPDILSQWVNGSKCTMRVEDASQATLPAQTSTDGCIVSAVTPTTEQTTKNQTNLFMTPCNQASQKIE